LTWSEKKRDILKGNHPNGRMVVFEKAAHGIFDEQPDDFFRVLRGFITGLPKVDEKALSGYRAFLDGFVAEMDISDSMKHSQYGLDYELSPFARKRLKTPFKRIENRSSD
jgi:hypothetical protein